MNDKIIVIGKVDDASAQRILIQYEAQTGAQHQWIPRKAITRQEALTDGRSVFSLEATQTDAGIYEPHEQFVGNSAPLITNEKDILIVSAFENDEDIPELSLDDSKPSFHKFDTPNIIKLEDANGDPIPQDIWGGALITGGRFETICDWDFEPILLPAYVPVQEGDNNQTAPRMQRVNNPKGESAVYLGFNPNFKNAREPAGALLGTYSDRYYPLPYPKLCRPILQRAALNGWQASVLAFDRGKQMRLDCDVSGAVHFKKGYGTDVISDKWTTVAEADSGWLAPETMMGLQEQVHSMWRYGFSIHNSLDGSGSLKVQAVARRNACTNAGVIGGQRVIAAMRHTKGVMEPVDWDDFAGTIDAVIVDAQRGLGHVEALKHVRLEDAQFERLMVLSEKAGLVSYPRPSRAKDTKGGLIGSHMWELFGHGWTNYNEPWVAVEPKDRGTLFHAYQVMTGAVTHKPEWTDGRRKLTGNTLKMNTFNQRLQKIDSLLTGIGTRTMKDYANEKGEAITDWNDFKSYVKDAGVTGLGDEVPTATEMLEVLYE